MDGAPEAQPGVPGDGDEGAFGGEPLRGGWGWARGRRSSRGLCGGRVWRRPCRSGARRAARSAAGRIRGAAQGGRGSPRRFGRGGTRLRRRRGRDGSRAAGGGRRLVCRPSGPAGSPRGRGSGLVRSPRGSRSVVRGRACARRGDSGVGLDGNAANLPPVRTCGCRQVREIHIDASHFTRAVTQWRSESPSPKTLRTVLVCGFPSPSAVRMVRVRSSGSASHSVGHCRARRWWRHRTVHTAAINHCRCIAVV